MNTLRPALVLLVLLGATTGLAYPVAVTMLAGLLFPAAAAGSLVERDGEIVGSGLVGQEFVSARYFHGRPSAARYDARAGSGSNLGPTSAALQRRVAGDAAAFRAGAGTMAPADAVTASGSGLDPHVSPETARGQAARVAGARGVSVDAVLALVEAHEEGRSLGFVGEPRVNVLSLNLALDRLVEQPDGRKTERVEH